MHNAIVNAREYIISHSCSDIIRAVSSSDGFTAVFDYELNLGVSLLKTKKLGTDIGRSCVLPVATNIREINTNGKVHFLKPTHRLSRGPNVLYPAERSVALKRKRPMYGSVTVRNRCTK